MEEKLTHRECVPFKITITLGWNEGRCGVMEIFPYHEPRRSEEIPRGPIAGTKGSDVVVEERVNVTSRDARS